MQDFITKISQILPILLIFFVFYFFIMRPQQKKAREHQEMIKHIKRGDSVVTTGGLMGVVERLIDETRVSLCIAEGIIVTIARSAISDVTRSGPSLSSENAATTKIMPTIKATTKKKSKK